MAERDEIDAAQREQLAKLMAWIAERGYQGGKYSPENLWALQGQQQLPPSPANPNVEMSSAYRDENLATPTQRVLPDPGFEYPQAMPGLRAPMNPWLSTEPSREPAPFGGKGEVIGPYELPKKKNKKKGKD